MAASLLSCAKALEVSDVAGCGRGVVTTRAVGAGEVLLSAVPYAVALDFPWLDNVCLGCAKTSRKPLNLRCEECKGAYYCSAACRDGLGRQRHRPVCGWEAPALAALRSLDAASAEPLCPEPFEETTVRLVLTCVLTHAEHESEKTAERVTERGAPVYTHVLQQCATPAALPPRTAALAQLAHAAFVQVLPPGVAPPLEEVLGLFARDECNGFGYWSQRYERMGVGSAPGAALFNHACTPNAVKVQAPGFRIEVRSLRALEAGEEVRFSYVPLNDDVATRRRVLARHFGFHCACERCAVDVEAGDAAAVPWNAHSCGGTLYPATGSGVRRQPCLRCSICCKEVPPTYRGDADSGSGLCGGAERPAAPFKPATAAAPETAEEEGEDEWGSSGVDDVSSFDGTEAYLDETEVEAQQREQEQAAPRPATPPPAPAAAPSGTPSLRARASLAAEPPAPPGGGSRVRGPSRTAEAVPPAPVVEITEQASAPPAAVTQAEPPVVFAPSAEQPKRGLHHRLKGLFTRDPPAGGPPKEPLPMPEEYSDDEGDRSTSAYTATDPDGRSRYTEATAPPPPPPQEGLLGRHSDREHERMANQL